MFQDLCQKGRKVAKIMQNPPTSVVLWEVQHAIRTRRRSPNTLFPCLVFLKNSLQITAKSSSKWIQIREKAMPGSLGVAFGEVKKETIFG